MIMLFEFGFGHYIAKTPWKKLFYDYYLLKGRVWSLFLLTELVSPLLVKFVKNILFLSRLVGCLHLNGLKSLSARTLCPLLDTDHHFAHHNELAWLEEQVHEQVAQVLTGWRFREDAA